MLSSRYPTALLPLLLVAMLAALSYWLDLATRPPAEPNSVNNPHTPDYYVEEFLFKRFDEQAALQHSMHGRLMQHFPNDDSTVVYSPDLTYYQSVKTNITANVAYMDSKGKHVEMVDNVRVLRSGVFPQEHTLLVTQRLDAYPDEQIASSDTPVTITQGGARLEAKRLYADNNQQQYLLEGAVRGIFPPGNRITSDPTVPQDSSHSELPTTR